jgi:WD40 repeat protein
MGQRLPEPFVMEGTLHDDRLTLMLPPDSRDPIWTFVRFASSTECSCGQDPASPPAWCWHHEQGHAHGVATTCWWCVFGALRGEPCPDCATHHLREGRLALLRGERERAAVWLAKALTMGADETRTRFLLGQCFAEPLLRTYEIEPARLPPEDPHGFRGSLFLSRSGGDAIEVGDLLTGEVLRRIPVGEVAGEDPTRVTLPPRGDWVVVSEAGRVRLVRVRGAEETRGVDLAGSLLVAFAFDGGGSHLAVATESCEVRIWAIEEEALRLITSFDAPPVFALAMDQAGTSAGISTLLGDLIVVADLATRARRIEVLPKSYPSHVSLDGHARRVLALGLGDSATVASFDPPNALGRTAGWPFEGSPRCMFLSRGMRLLEASPNVLRLYDLSPSDDPPGPVREGAVRVLCEVARLENSGAWLEGSAATPDALRFATGDAQGGVRVWDATTMALLAAYPGGGTALRHVGFSADGEHLVACDVAGRVRVWRTAPDVRPPAKITAEAEARAKLRVVGRKLVPLEAGVGRPM